MTTLILMLRPRKGGGIIQDMDNVLSDMLKRHPELPFNKITKRLSPKGYPFEIDGWMFYRFRSDKRNDKHLLVRASERINEFQEKRNRDE